MMLVPVSFGFSCAPLIVFLLSVSVSRKRDKGKSFSEIRSQESPEKDDACVCGGHISLMISGGYQEVRSNALTNGLPLATHAGTLAA